MKQNKKIYKLIEEGIELQLEHIEDQVKLEKISTELLECFKDGIVFKSWGSVFIKDNFALMFNFKNEAKYTIYDKIDNVFYIFKYRPNFPICKEIKEKIRKCVGDFS